jgi:hypothetical protein
MLGAIGSSMTAIRPWCGCPYGFTYGAVYQNRLSVFDVCPLSRYSLQNESNSMENKLSLLAILRRTEGHFHLLFTYLWNTINPWP